MERLKTAGAVVLVVVLAHLGFAAMGAGVFAPRTASAQNAVATTPRTATTQCTRWEMQLSGDLGGTIIPTSTDMEPVGVAYDARTRTTRALLRRCTSHL